jgi:phosphoglucomutase
VKVETIASQPFEDQRPGTAGLRKTVERFREPNYLANFVQSIFDELPDLAGGILVIGGDGRYYNDHAIATILRMAAANGVQRAVVGRDGLLSTPAASHLIRQLGAAGGFILSASHNPGGPEGDFGIKFNVASGGQASEQLTEAIYRRCLAQNRYRLADADAPSLAHTGHHAMGSMTVEIVDPVVDYAGLMERLFDFERIAGLLRSPDFHMLYDARHAITGPYAHDILCARLGLDPACVLNGEPKADFAGLHPDPNPHDAADLVARFSGPDSPDFGAASDGDGDRNMILAPGRFVSPGDSLALLCAHARSIPAFRDGLAGVARSMPTSRAVDRVAAALGIPCFETPTGWRFFCNLLEAGRIDLCGEESFGTGSSHVREKDGLWAVLFWLNLVALHPDRGVNGLLTDHWKHYGRDYFLREDYFIEDRQQAEEVMGALGERLASLSRTRIGSGMITDADCFDYIDPVDGSESRNQGIRVAFEDARIVYRLSGTGTRGATLRVYLEQYQPPAGHLDGDARRVLAPLAQTARDLARLTDITGLTRPTQQT